MAICQSRNHNSLGGLLQRVAPWGSVMNGWGKVGKGGEGCACGSDVVRMGKLT